MYPFNKIVSNALDVSYACKNARTFVHHSIVTFQRNFEHDFEEQNVSHM